MENLMFQELYKLPDKCIYAFLNESDKKIYIGMAKNIVTSLSRNISEMKYSNHPCKNDVSKLKFEILENIVTDRDLKLKYQYYSNKYKNEGWTLYRDYCAISYKVLIDVLNVNKLYGMPSIKCCVKLRSRGYRELTVGLFETVEEAEVFVANNYSNSPITNIIYADNKLTRYYNAE